MTCWHGEDAWHGDENVPAGHHVRRSHADVAIRASAAAALVGGVAFAFAAGHVAAAPPLAALATVMAASAAEPRRIHPQLDHEYAMAGFGVTAFAILTCVMLAIGSNLSMLTLGAVLVAQILRFVLQGMVDGEMREERSDRAIAIAPSTPASRAGRATGSPLDRIAARLADRAGTAESAARCRALLAWPADDLRVQEARVTLDALQEACEAHGRAMRYATPGDETALDDRLAAALAAAADASESVRVALLHDASDDLSTRTSFIEARTGRDAPW